MNNEVFDSANMSDLAYPVVFPSSIGGNRLTAALLSIGPRTTSNKLLMNSTTFRLRHVSGKRIRLWLRNRLRNLVMMQVKCTSKSIKQILILKIIIRSLWKIKIKAILDLSPYPPPSDNSSISVKHYY
jgi:hypothetical protein